MSSDEKTDPGRWSQVVVPSGGWTSGSTEAVTPQSHFSPILSVLGMELAWEDVIRSTQNFYLRKKRAIY